MCSNENQKIFNVKEKKIAIYKLRRVDSRNQFYWLLEPGLLEAVGK